MFDALMYAKTGMDRLLLSRYSHWTYPANDMNQNMSEASHWQDDTTPITSLVFVMSAEHLGGGQIHLFRLK